MSLAQSIWMGLTSQQIIQLDQLCYPFDTQLFKHPWTDERSCKTGKMFLKNTAHLWQRSELEFLAPKLIWLAMVGSLLILRGVCLVELPRVLEWWNMLRDQGKKYRWWRIQMRMYIEGNGESPNATFLVPSKNSCMVCFGAFQRTFRVLQRSRQTLGKKTPWQNCKYSNVLPRIFRRLSPVVRKPFGFLPLRSQTANAQQGSSLTLRNPFSSADSANVLKFWGWWVYPQIFIISLTSEIWKILEVHHGALERKPFFQPNQISHM